MIYLLQVMLNSIFGALIKYKINIWKIYIFKVLTTQIQDEIFLLINLTSVWGTV
jgi:hypothetical protein